MMRLMVLGLLARGRRGRARPGPRRRTVLLAAPLQVVIGGCGPPAGPDVAAPAQPVTDGRYGGSVTDVRALSGTRFDVTLESIDADLACSTDPTARVTDEQPEAVYGTTTYTASSHACGSSALSTTLELPTELDGRVLVVDQQAWVLEPAGATTGPLRRCDDTLGCHPVPAGCDGDSYRLAIDAGDFPRNGRTWTERACTVELVLDHDPKRADLSVRMLG